MFKKALIAASVAGAALVAPTAANAQYYPAPSPYYGGGGYYGGNGYYGGGYNRGYYPNSGYGSRYYGGDYYGQRCNGTTGTIVGGVAGAVIGSQVSKGRRGYDYYGRRSRGNGTVGALIGGALGAVVGNQIDKGSCRR